MDSAPRATRNPARPSRVAHWLLPLAIGLLVAPGIAGCTASHEPSTAAMTMTPTATPMHDMTPVPASTQAAAMDAVWAARPAYVRADARTEEAYAYALEASGALQWIPCYCGCAAMGHRNNVDCYFKGTAAGQPPQYEEHASYCEVCVDTTLMVKRLLAQGQSLLEIRQAVDKTFGGGAAPGTPTELPPA